MSLNPVECPVVYSENGSWRKTTTYQYPLYLGPNSRPYWNDVSVLPHVITESTNGKYVISWIVASNMVDTPVFCIMGQGGYTSLTQAERADYSELDLQNLPVVELRPLYKLIYEVKNSYANLTNSNLVEVVDIRYLQSAGGVIPGAPGATGPQGDTGATGPGLPSTTTYGEYLYSNGSTFVVGGSKISLGNNAGQVDQSSNAVAIGQNAGKTNQGPYAIAIGAGAGTSNQGSNSIIINATGIDISNNTANTLYIAPIASSIDTSNVLIYNTTTHEINYSTSKTFVIDHPTNPNKYLVHACLEGPEAGVYYRGKAEITDNQTKTTTIHLPEYTSTLATDFTISLTPVYNGSNTLLCMSEVENNSFNVYGEPCKFHWVVYAKRSDIIVEPVKDSITLKGDGPYKYIAN
jgi:hypothetical protein